MTGNHHIRTLMVLALAVLSACAAQLTAPDRATLTVARQDIVVAAPAGLCIDPASIDVTRAGGFALITDCALTTAAVTAPIQLNGVLTASVSTGGIPGTLDDLEDFLTGPGVVTLGKSGAFDQIRVLATRQTDNILFLKIEDKGDPIIPGGANRFWRAFFEVKGRLVSASFVPFAADPVPDTRTRQILTDLATATRAANAAQTSS